MIREILRGKNLYTLLGLSPETPLGQIYDATSNLVGQIRSLLPTVNSNDAKQAVYSAEKKLKQALLSQIQSRVATHGIRNAWAVSGTDAPRELQANLQRVYADLVDPTDTFSSQTWQQLQTNATQQLQMLNGVGSQTFSGTAMELDIPVTSKDVEKYAGSLNDSATWYEKMKKFKLATNSEFANAPQGYESITQEIAGLYNYPEVTKWETLACPSKKKIGPFEIKLSHECTDERFKTELPSAYIKINKKGLQLRNLRDYIEALKNNQITEPDHNILFEQLRNFWPNAPTKIVCVNQTVPILTFSFVKIELQDVPTYFLQSIENGFKIGDSVSYNDRISLRGGTITDTLRLNDGTLLYELRLTDNTTVQATANQLKEIVSSQLSQELKFLSDEWIGQIDDIGREDKMIQARTRQQATNDVIDELPEDDDGLGTIDESEDSESESSGGDDDGEATSLWNPVDNLKDVELTAFELTTEIDNDDDNRFLSVESSDWKTEETVQKVKEESTGVNPDVDKLRPPNGRLQSSNIDEEINDPDVLFDLKESLPDVAPSSQPYDVDTFDDVDRLGSSDQLSMTTDNYLPDETIADVLSDIRQATTVADRDATSLEDIAIDEDTLGAAAVAPRGTVEVGGDPVDVLSDIRQASTVADRDATSLEDITIDEDTLGAAAVPPRGTVNVAQTNQLSQHLIRDRSLINNKSDVTKIGSKNRVTFAEFQGMKNLNKNSFSRWPQLEPLLKKFIPSKAPTSQEINFLPVTSRELTVAQSVLNTHVIFKVTDTITLAVGQHLKKLFEPLLRGITILRLDRLFVSDCNQKILGFVLIETFESSGLKQSIPTRLSKCLKKMLPEYKSSVLFDFNPRLQVDNVSAKTKNDVSMWVFTLEKNTVK